MRLSPRHARFFCRRPAGQGRVRGERARPRGTFHDGDCVAVQADHDQFVPCGFAERRLSFRFADCLGAFVSAGHHPRRSHRANRVARGIVAGRHIGPRRGRPARCDGGKRRRPHLGLPVRLRRGSRLGRRHKRDRADIFGSSRGAFFGAQCPATRDSGERRSLRCRAC